MKRLGKWMGPAGLGIVLLLTACTNQAAPQRPTRTQSMAPATPQQLTQTQPTHNVGNPDTVIPSVDRDKKLTTNAHGTTYSGMGSNLYSSIGSSHLHSGGPSTKLEAQLNAAGVHGVQALIVNDMVFLAPSTAKSQSINHMDPMQSHLLNNFAGSSNRGSEPSDNIPGKGSAGNGTAGTLGTSDRNATFEQARAQVERMYGTDAEVRIVTSKKGVDALEKVKKQMKENKHTADDLNKLFHESKR
ncbi:hypothetical protein [Brevibacillus sp. NRS-1366]|uniref:hypothetical protein n=1 Tax=Brevibacillus sp. NRS-1366 TaxID=3233899 RepID=UPI003D20002D